MCTTTLGSAEEADGEGQEVSKSPLGWMRFPQGYADKDGDRLWGYHLGDGTAVLFYLDGYNRVNVVRVSTEDAKEVQTRHHRLQVDLCWYAELPNEHANDYVFDSIIGADLFADITAIEAPAEPTPLWAKRIETRPERSRFGQGRSADRLNLTANRFPGTEGDAREM